MLYSVIMAGGSGTRFWPLSRRGMPKQAMPFLGGESLFQRAVGRLEGLAPPGRTFVITNVEQAGLLASQAPEIPRENIVGEPVGRDSAAAVFLGAAIIAARDSEAVILVKTADHLISPVERFHDAVSRAAALAQNGLLVTFGIPPSYPATGYGYIERGAALERPAGTYEVARFHEKPDLETARGYLEAGGFYWNSGMFVWRAADILAAAEKYAPEHYRAIAPLGALFGTGQFEEAMKKAYGPLKKLSIDYAVMEKAPNIATVEAGFDWSDVGSPASLKGCAEADGDGNITQGLTETLESSGCVLISGADHLLAAVGCKDLVVIHTPEATLVCPANRAEEVKKLVSKLESRGDTAEFL